MRNSISGFHNHVLKAFNRHRARTFRNCGAKEWGGEGGGEGRRRTVVTDDGLIICGEKSSYTHTGLMFLRVSAMKIKVVTHRVYVLPQGLNKGYQ